jgi:phosphomethylpyrimidine synthase
MNAPVTPPKGLPHAVTTGPIQGSRKVYASPQGHPDIQVPFREIALSDPKEAPVRVYDPSGPYTDTQAVIDLSRGLPSCASPGWPHGATPSSSPAR